MTKRDTTSKNIKKKQSNVSKTDNKKHLQKNKINSKEDKSRFYLMLIVIFLLGVLLIFSAYAWFSTALNVKVKTFNMVVTRNSGLSISFDAINYDSYVEISRESLITSLKNTYPNNLSQWASTGLTPVSSPGIRNSNSYFFEIYSSSGVRYRNKKKDNGFITTVLAKEQVPRAFNSYIAFDLFFKNVTGSPVSDNLYLDYGTEVTMESESSEEMVGLVNSIRIGFVKVGSVPLDTPAQTIQNLQCNNNCKSIIFEPNSTLHSDLSIERSKKYGIDLIDGETFPTYAYIKEGGPIYVADTVSGSANLNREFFALQNTMTDKDFDKPLFGVPDGITKVRVYVWIEGQDIDSLETDSDGAEIAISINFIKDTQGYNEFN